MANKNLLKKGILISAVLTAALTIPVVSSYAAAANKAETAAVKDQETEASDDTEIDMIDEEDPDETDQDDPGSDDLTPVDTDCDGTDSDDEYECYYGTLTDEQLEQLNAIYERIDEIDTLIWGENYENYNADMTDEELEALYAPYEDELNDLYDQAYALEEEGGMYDDTYYGSLTDDQIEELNDLYEKIDEIATEIFGEDYGNYDEDMTDEEIEALYAPYEDQLNEIYAQIEALEEAGGLNE